MQAPQRPLWASTATKNPAYSDVLYAEQLIARATVNTMPEATLRRFADHGQVSRGFRRDHRRRDAAPRRAAGVDLAAITVRLEREGVRSACDSYHALLDRIEGKLRPTSTAVS